MRATQGLLGLASSKKACMSLLVLGCATAGMLLGKLDGPSYAVVIGVVTSFYQYTSHRVEIAAMKGELK